MAAFHVVYGLRVEANGILPGLPVQYNAGSLDVQIQLKSGWPFPSTVADVDENIYESSEGVAGGQSNLSVGLFPGGLYFAFFYGDGARFAVEGRGREVWADWPENCSLEDACTYLVGPVMGFVLRLRGAVCLHASAVAVGDRAIALVGPTGSGKSTTAAAFASSGFPVLSDDIAALSCEDGQWLVQPGYPRVNLWSDSVRTLFGSENALPHITPTWEKRYLPLGQNGHHFASSPLPLGAIYILDGLDSALTAPVIEEFSEKEALLALIANTYVNYLLDRNMRRTEFELLSRVVSTIPVRRVRAPDEPSALFSLCETIAKDAARVMGAAPANSSSALG